MDVLFASRLARLPVLDPDQDPARPALGRLEDVVVGAPGRESAPPVLGFVVAVPGRRIFVAAGRVAALEPEGVRLRTGALNLRRYDPRPAEALVLADLLDRRTPDGLVVNDVGISPTGGAARGWEVAVVDLSPPAPRLRPSLGRRRHRVEPWDALRPLLPLGGADRHAALRDLHPVEIAEALHTMPASERFAAARSLADDQLADLLEELDEDEQARLLGAFDTERAADVLEAMDPDDAADLLGELPARRRGELLAAIEPDDAHTLRRLLRYPRDTAGGMMNPEPALLPPTATVATALALLRDDDLSPAMAAQVFVAEAPGQTPTGRFLGTASIQRLLRETPSTTLASCASDEPEPVGPELTEAELAVRMASYDLLAVPVCNAAGQLLGVVTVDDVVDAILPEGWRS